MSSALATRVLADAESLGAAEAVVRVDHERRGEQRRTHDRTQTERDGHHRMVTVWARVGTGWASAVSEGAVADHAQVAHRAVRAAAVLATRGEPPADPSPGFASRAEPGAGNATGAPLPRTHREELIERVVHGDGARDVLGVEYVETTTRTSVVRTGAAPVCWSATRRRLWHWVAGVGGNHLEGHLTWGEPIPDPARVSALRAELGAARDARHPVAPGRYALLISPAVAVHLTDLLASALNGRNIVSGMAALRGRLGRAIASPVVSVVDDGRLGHGPYGAALDDEGTPTGDNMLVDRGALRGFLHSTSTARICAQRPNGCAVRQLPGGPTSPGVRGFRLLPGSDDHATLRGHLTHGLEAVAVTRPAVRVDGGRRVRLGVCGWLVADGQRVRPVGPFRIEVGLFGWLRQVRACGDTLLHSALFRGVAAPSVLLDEASVECP